MYHVPSLSANMLSIFQLTQIGKIMEFWMDKFLIKDLKNDRSIGIEGFLDPRIDCISFMTYSNHFLNRLLLLHKLMNGVESGMN